MSWHGSCQQLYTLLTCGVEVDIPYFLGAVLQVTWETEVARDISQSEGLSYDDSNLQEQHDKQASLVTNQNHGR